jgi:transcriptional regulator NrdR family protein
MQCPSCGSEDLKTVDSRPSDGMIRRRKECKSCGGRFSTYEITEKEYNRLKRLVKVSQDPWYKEIFGDI